MKKIVITIREDVCAANNKTEENVGKLLEVLHGYGTVADFDKEVADVKAEYQDNLNQLTAQLNAIKANALTTDEIRILNHYRECKAVICAEKDAEIAKRDEVIAEAKNKMKNIIERVVAAVGE